MFFRSNEFLRSKDGRVEYFNFWDGQSAEEIWFTSFLKYRKIVEKYPRDIFVFFSLLGSPQLLKKERLLHLFSTKRRRVFFTGENVHYEVFKDYDDNWVCQNGIELSLGFDYLDSSKYIRFPLWILEMFPPNSSVSEIRKICKCLSHHTLSSERNRFATIISGIGSLFGPESINIRTEIVENLNTIHSVDCAGKLLHNTDDLQGKFNDNKAEFLKLYKFNICPENTSIEGYVTEKVFHAIGAGCIPIYRGALNTPEPEVLNHDAVLFWEKDDDNDTLIRKVEELWQNPNMYKDFFEQPRLQPHAWEVVAEYFDSLERKLDEICRNA